MANSAREKPWFEKTQRTYLLRPAFSWKAVTPTEKVLRVAYTAAPALKR